MRRHLGQHEGRDIKVRRCCRPHERLPFAQLLEPRGLGPNLFDRILGQVPETREIQRQRFQLGHADLARREIEPSLTRSRGAINLKVVSRCIFVVASQWLVGGIGYAVLKHL